MCCYIDKNKTEQLRKRLEKQGFITAYKVYEGGCDMLRPACYSSYRVTRAGWIKSDRPSIDQDVTTDDGESEEYCGEWYSVNRGIHVVLTKKETKSWVEILTNPKVVPVRCYKKDLVAAGRHGDAVFLKVFLAEKDYDKATK